MRPSVKCAIQVFIAGILIVQATLANAQSSDIAYPTKTIRVLVGVPPGGTTDATARMFAAWLQESLGQAAIVENRPGANTAVAASAVTQSPADGYTLLVATDAYITIPLLTKLAYDPFKDLVPVGTLTVVPFMFVVHPSLPISSIKELIAYAKANPGQLNFGSSGNASASHLGGEKFKMMTGTDIVHVPYKGAGPALIDAVSGQIQLSAWTPLAAGPHVKAGKLRPLAVTGTHRVSSLPDVPTFAEAGLPEYHHRAWLGVYAPAATPKPIVDKVAGEIRKMLADPAIKKKLQEEGAEPYLSTQDEFAQMMRSETEELRKLVKAADIKMD